MDKDTLQQLVLRNMSIEAIAQHTGSTKAKVRYQLKIHNLKTLTRDKPHLCKVCGETSKENFYGKQKEMCKKCRTREDWDRKKYARSEVVKLMGGKCNRCGYDKCEAALDFHHTDPNSKDPNYYRLRHYPAKLKDEVLTKCELLCANCHREHHHYN